VLSVSGIFFSAFALPSIHDAASLSFFFGSVSPDGRVPAPFSSGEPTWISDSPSGSFLGSSVLSSVFFSRRCFPRYCAFDQLPAMLRCELSSGTFPFPSFFPVSAVRRPLGLRIPSFYVCLLLLLGTGERAGFLVFFSPPVQPRL